MMVLASFSSISKPSLIRVIHPARVAVAGDPVPRTTFALREMLIALLARVP